MESIFEFGFREFARLRQAAAGRNSCSRARGARCAWRS